METGILYQKAGLNVSFDKEQKTVYIRDEAKMRDGLWKDLYERMLGYSDKTIVFHVMPAQSGRSRLEGKYDVHIRQETVGNRFFNEEGVVRDQTLKQVIDWANSGLDFFKSNLSMPDIDDVGKIFINEHLEAYGKFKEALEELGKPSMPAQ